MKIIKHFIIQEEEKEFFCIILHHYRNNLFNLIYKSNFINKKIYGNF